MRPTSLVITALAALAAAPALAAEPARIVVALNATVDTATGKGLVNFTPDGILAAEDRGVLKTFLAALAADPAGVAFAGKMLPLSVASGDQGLALDFQTTPAAALGRRVFGCAGQWLASLSGVTSTEVYGYLSHDDDDLAEERLEGYADDLAAFMTNAGPDCGTFDTEANVEPFVVTRLRRYLEAKAAEAPLAPDLVATGWLVSKAHVATGLRVKQELHDAEIAALKAWTDRLKAGAVEPVFEARWPRALALLEEKRTLGPARFALAALQESLPAGTIPQALAASDTARLAAWAEVLDTAIGACTADDGQVSAILCGGDELAERVRWLYVKRASGDFKFLRSVR